MFQNKKAFTLVELVIAIFISAIILFFISAFIGNVFNEIAYNNSKIKFINQLYQFETNISNIRNIYSSGEILIDNQTGTGSDVILLKSSLKNDGYIIAMVNLSDEKIDKNNNVDYINYKILGVKKLTNSQLTELNSDSSKVYNYKFYSDELYNEILLKDLQGIFFNSGTILNLEFFTNIGYKDSLKYEKFSENPDLTVKKYLLNF